MDIESFNPSRNRQSYLEHNKEDSWLDEELAGCHFKDPRLGKRLRTLLHQLSCGIGESLSFVCQDWANTKAAYRFLSNERVNEREILKGHFQATQHRFKATQGPILVLHDTTEFSYRRKKSQAIGFTGMTYTRRDKEGRPLTLTVCGLLLHSSLVVTPEGLPLGLGAVKFWTRQKFKGINALKKKINLTRLSIEEKESKRWIDNMRDSVQGLQDPERCVHVADREGDIYELFCMACQEKTHFLIRTSVNRLAEDGTSTIYKELDKVDVKGLHSLKVTNKKGEEREAILTLKYHRLKILPPLGKQKKYPELFVTVIHAQEISASREQDPIRWHLITDLPIHCVQEVKEKLEWYAMRWKIETFHKILKSGCRAEVSKLRTAERLINLLAIFCVLSWRIFWMTMMNRVSTQTSARIALTQSEIHLLDHLLAEEEREEKHPSLSLYLTKIAKLGGYLGRTKDPPPGNMVIWRGMSRLADIEWGFKIASRLVGN